MKMIYERPPRPRYCALPGCCCPLALPSGLPAGAMDEVPLHRSNIRVDCTATGQTWVDATTTLDTIQNRIWFTLRMGGHRNRELQRVWTAHGPDALSFEVVEVFPTDASTYAVERLLRDRQAHWLDALDASPCL